MLTFKIHLKSSSSTSCCLSIDSELDELAFVGPFFRGLSLGKSAFDVLLLVDCLDLSGARNEESEN